MKTLTVKQMKNACELLGARFTKNALGWTIKDADGDPVCTDNTLEESLESLRVYYGGHPQFEEIMVSEGISEGLRSIQSESQYPY